LFELAYKTVLGVQGVGSGFDVAAAIWGGTIYYIKGEKRVEQIYCDDYPLIVGYTGVKANTPKLVRRVAIQRKKNLKKTGETFTQIERLVKTAKLALKNKDYRRLGKLMNANQERLIDLGVSSRKIEKLIKVCIECGAWGAKLSGAGGGDCIIGLAENNRRSQIEEKINLAGGEVIQVKHSAEGVRLETETR
jgi:mevalonate kinase